MGPFNYNHEFPQNVSAGQPKFCPYGHSHRPVASTMSDKSLEVAGHRCRNVRLTRLLGRFPVAPMLQIVCIGRAIGGFFGQPLLGCPHDLLLAV